MAGTVIGSVAALIAATTVQTLLARMVPVAGATKKDAPAAEGKKQQ